MNKNRLTKPYEDEIQKFANNFTQVDNKHAFENFSINKINNLEECKKCEYAVHTNADCIRSMTDMQECKLMLYEAFPGSFVNDRGEFIVHPRTNQYFCLQNCKTPLDIECKLLEWLSRAACITVPYLQEWRNRKFHEFMRNGINDFLDTDFSEDDFDKIYTALGNAINHEKTIEFIESGYDFALLEV